jgi:general L-amino acid transport system permease protein
MSSPPRAAKALKPWRWLWWLPVAWLAWHVFDWALWNAVFSADLPACKALQHQGACWGVAQAKGMDWLFGGYPVDQRWRPALAMLIWLSSIVWQCLPAFFEGARRSNGSAWLALLAWPAGIWLMSGQGLGLPVIESALWGGLPLTLLLTALTLILGAPLSLALAWARHKGAAWVSWPVAAVIEVVRGAPLVMWLFGAAFVLPGLLPADWHWGPLARVLLVTTLFSAAYAAEILRGSLATVLRDQSEAAAVLGASWWQTQAKVVVPQVWRNALPPLTSHAIGVLKDTALVTIVSLQDLTGAMSVSLNGDADWRPFFLEAYLVIAVVYALMCLSVAALGQRLEARQT